MSELTIGQVIDGFRYAPFGSIEERAEAIARYFSRGKVAVTLERIDGTIAHFVQQTMLEDSMFHVRGSMGDFYRFERSRFEIDMAPLERAD